MNHDSKNLISLRNLQFHRNHTMHWYLFFHKWRHWWFALHPLLLLSDRLPWHRLIGVGIFLSIVSAEKQWTKPFFKGLTEITRISAFVIIIIIVNDQLVAVNELFVPAHLGFVPASQSSLPVAGERPSRHHAAAANTGFAVAIWLQQQHRQETASHNTLSLCKAFSQRQS